MTDSWKGSSGSDDDSGKTTFSGNTSTNNTMSKTTNCEVPVHAQAQTIVRVPFHKQLTEKASNGISLYKEFLGNHRFVLRLTEDALSRLVLYAPSRFVSHEDIDYDDDDYCMSGNTKRIQPEYLYALIHLWTLLNDSLYYGLGDGQGFTVRSDNNNIHTYPNDNGDDPEDSFQYTTAILRSILTILECLAPAIEVSAYTSFYSTNRRNHTNTVKSDSREWNVLKVMSILERIKFVCRLGLLTFYYKQRITEFSSNDDLITISGAGILQEGGLLEPGEKVTKESAERRRISKLLYVGKRTGRRSVRTNNGVDCDHRRYPAQHDKLSLQRLLERPQVKVLLLAAGEILHIYRPLYWTTSCRDSAKFRKADGSRIYREIKILLQSLAIDIFSRILSISGSRVKSAHGSTIATINISSGATNMELQRRKMRWFLYLLRAPIWDVFTNPASQFGGKVLSYVPFVGRPLARYLIDLLLYWKKWHFMLESP